jgi:hypothetical protein
VQTFGLNIPTPHSTHSLSALEMLRISLSGPPNRRIQPERYVAIFFRIVIFIPSIITVPIIAFNVFITRVVQKLQFLNNNRLKIV